MDNVEIIVPEFEYRAKTTFWYVFFGLIIAIMISLAILLKNYTFIGVIVLGSIFILMRSIQKPKNIMLAMHADGIYLGNKHYPYADIKDFSLIQLDNQSYFVFNPIGRFQTPTKFPVSEPDQIRRKLNNLVTEVEYQESLLDALLRLIGL